MANLLKLHFPNGIDLDPCFNVGTIYTGIDKPKLKFDLNPRTMDTKKRDCRNLYDVSSGSIKSLLFDPPFLAGGGDTGKFTKKYGSFETISSLLTFYNEAMLEIHRVLGFQGRFIFKCQDICNGRTQTFSHCEIYSMALEMGFYALDLMILETKNKIGITNQKNQFHARKSHCYFWVFEKSKRKNKVFK